MKKKRRVTAKDLLYSRLIFAAGPGYEQELKRILTRIKTMTRKNPTPLLRDLKHIAWLDVRRFGRAEAHRMATQIARTAQVQNDTRTERRYKLLARLILQVKAKKHATRKTMLDKLIADHGTTSPMSARGFILTDGECLNLGQYDDHRIICGVLSGDYEKRYGSRYGAFKHLCGKFNMIRWIPESKMAEVFVEPTGKQLSALRELAENGMLNEIEVHPPRRSSCIIEAQDADTLIDGVEALYA